MQASDPASPRLVLGEAVPAPVEVEPRPAFGGVTARFEWSDPAAREFTLERVQLVDAQASRENSSTSWGDAYHARLEEIYRFLVPAGGRVLELGCGRGDLLAATRPAVGIGIDFSPEM